MVWRRGKWCPRRRALCWWRCFPLVFPVRMKWPPVPGFPCLNWSRTPSRHQEGNYTLLSLIIERLSVGSNWCRRRFVAYLLLHICLLYAGFALVAHGLSSGPSLLWSPLRPLLFAVAAKWLSLLTLWCLRSETRFRHWCASRKAPGLRLLGIESRCMNRRLVALGWRSMLISNLLSIGTPLGLPRQELCIAHECPPTIFNNAIIIYINKLFQ